jgi:serine/threonine-protein kinase
MALTDSAAIIGSPLYMAPEQMRSARTADIRSDIWALGVILYELVAGETPFEAADANAVMKLVRTRNVPRLRKVAPSASPMLEDLVMTCLDRDRRKRFENAGALHAALELVRLDLERGSRTKVDTLPEAEDLGPVKSGRPANPPAKSTSDALPGTSSRLAAIALKPARPPTKRRRAALLTLSGPEDPVAWDEDVPPAPPSSSRKLDAGPARVDPRADAGSEPPKRPRTAADVIREAEAASASKSPAIARGGAAPPLPSGPSSPRASSSAATSSRASSPAATSSRASSSSGAGARAEPASARTREPRGLHDDLDLEPPPSSRHGGPAGDLEFEPPSSRHARPAVSLEMEAPPSPRHARPLPTQSSIPPVLDPRSAVGPAPAPGAVGRPAASKSDEPPPVPEAPPRSVRGEAREASQEARPVAPPASVRPARPAAVPVAASPAAQEDPWSTRDKANLGLLIVGPALVAFLALLFAPSVTAHLGHAMRGDTPLASGVLTVFTLVAAAALAARSLGASRSTPMIIATVGAVLLGIVMIIVTFSASETAESGISPAAASVVPFLAPVVPLALAIAAFNRARELWLSRYERREAITFVIVASVMVFAFLEVGPLGAVRRLGPPGGSAPSGHAN